ncbi:MAG: hypothetical protein V4592_21685 [Bacteroidota bacterium]
MIKNFTTEVSGKTFRFNTLHATILKVFQVYVMHEGKPYRFHMQLNESGVFHITQPEHCHQEYLVIEKELIACILKSQDAAVAA